MTAEYATGMLQKKYQVWVGLTKEATSVWADNQSKESRQIEEFDSEKEAQAVVTVLKNFKSMFFKPHIRIGYIPIEDIPIIDNKEVT